MTHPARYTVADLNILPPDAAAAEFLRCCGSTNWARLMTAARPFASEADMADVADSIWTSLAPADWLEAFAAHPRIGETRPARNMDRAPAARPGGHGDSMSNWSAIEQSGVQSVDSGVRERLAQGNRQYEARFGYIFIVCATGKSADEMLELLERRLSNAPADELQIAAREQGKITRLRLGKLVGG
jgi:2-oxo-4-hydroxy-4-carboxy-5-ureidoimidazoline decarboxylase